MKILVPASPRLGVNAVTGEGLAHAVAGVDTVVRGMDDFIRALFNATGDPRSVLTDPDARYFGAVLDEHSIVRARAESTTLFATRFDEWLASRAQSGAS